MKFKIITLEQVPLLAPDEFTLASSCFDKYPSFCGPGKGIGDLVVPETMYGLKVSPACHIHDITWKLYNKNRQMFFLSNAVFLFNLVSICCTKTTFFPLRVLRVVRCITYWWAVMTLGEATFFGRE